MAAGPIEIVGVEANTVLSALHQADALNIDLTDAVLLSSVIALGASTLVTDDSKLAQACKQFNLVVENPIAPTLRQQIAAWETANLPTKGLPRILRQIYQWLDRTHPQTAQDFWSQTGSGSHLP